MLAALELELLVLLRQLLEQRLAKETERRAVSLLPLLAQPEPQVLPVLPAQLVLATLVPPAPQAKARRARARTQAVPPLATPLPLLPEPVL